MDSKKLSPEYLEERIRLHRRNLSAGIQSIKAEASEVSDNVKRVYHNPMGELGDSLVPSFSIAQRYPFITVAAVAIGAALFVKSFPRIKAATQNIAAESSVMNTVHQETNDFIDRSIKKISTTVKAKLLQMIDSYLDTPPQGKESRGTEFLH